MSVLTPATASPLRPGVRARSAVDQLRRLAALCGALSLDVVLGVLAGAMLAAWVARATLPWSFWALLPACTWVLYALDHLHDAVRLGEGAGTARHRVHARHARPIAAAVAVVVAAGAVVVATALPPRLLVGGLIVGAAALLHLGMAGARSAAWPKEASAAVVYGAGLWFGPLLAAPGLGPELVALAAIHVVAAFANLALCSWIDAEVDQRDGHPSLASRHGAERARATAIGASTVGAAAAAVGAVLAAGRPAAAFAALAVVAATPAALAVAPRSARPAGRALADLVFLLLVLPPLAAGLGWSP